MTTALATFSNIISRSRTQAEVAKDKARIFADEHKTSSKTVDITIRFIGARGLPKMDVVGTADPYFIAKLDDRIAYQ